MNLRLRVRVIKLFLKDGLIYMRRDFNVKCSGGDGGDNGGSNIYSGGSSIYSGGSSNNSGSSDGGCSSSRSRNIL